ncbi:MAG: hypothetical protein F9B45_04425 [Phycisphaera sp. RhM]|nr:hypothetical protein [Phycisphaera sp. RhM]
MQKVTGSRMGGAIKRILRAAELDRAVFYALMSRGWQLGSGVLTNLLIAYTFTGVVQGFYYTFGSLLAMQAVAELGLHWIIVHAASHEWSALSQNPDGSVRGEARAHSRLAELLRATRKWFAIAAIVFTVVVLVIGVVFFSQKPFAVAWMSPWILSCLLCGQSLALSPSIAVLEGCDQMATVNRFRLMQLVLGSVCVWCAMLLGLGLWAVPVGFAVRLGVELTLVKGKYGAFLRSLRNHGGDHQLNWRTEIWPLQWRAAVQAPAQYLAFQTITPITFHFYGPTLAGMMGMTWTILNVLQQGAFTWLQSRAPQFGILIASRKPAELRRLFMKVSSISSLVLLVAIAAFLIALIGLNALDSPIAEHLSGRLLQPATAAVFAMATLAGHLPQCLNLYLRSYKRAPLFWGFLFANLVTAASVYLGVRHWGMIGGGVALLSVSIAIRIPLSVVVGTRFQKRFESENQDAN